MSKVFVFCIGGTGLRVMKSAIMMMASGMKTNGHVVVPVVIDPHLDLDEQKNLHSLIEKYQEIYQRTTTDDGVALGPLDGFFGAEIRTLDDMNRRNNNRAMANGVNASFRSYIGQTRLHVNDINNWLVQTLFSTTSLNSTLSVGFKGNPNVGTVVLGDMMDRADWFSAFRQHCEQGDRVFIVSSIFGGTGASGFPLLEKKIRNAVDCPAVQNALMGAGTVLPYYGLQDPRHTASDIDSANFYTKTKAALAYYEHSIKSDYLYYAGEQSLKAIYDNDEAKQEDKANFIELVAASALFHFLGQDKPEGQQFLTRSIDSDENTLTLSALGNGYLDIVTATANFLMLDKLTQMLPTEKYFPLSQSHGLDDKFYGGAAFKALQWFCGKYREWYAELAQNKRAFAPVNVNAANKSLASWVHDRRLDAKDDSYYLLQMLRQRDKQHGQEHNNPLRHLLHLAYHAINNYTTKLNN